MELLAIVCTIHGLCREIRVDYDSWFACLATGQAAVASQLPPGYSVKVIRCGGRTDVAEKNKA